MLLFLSFAADTLTVSNSISPIVTKLITTSIERVNAIFFFTDIIFILLSPVTLYLHVFSDCNDTSEYAYNKTYSEENDEEQRIEAFKGNDGDDCVFL